jgi:hypothetical protein
MTPHPPFGHVLPQGEKEILTAGSGSPQQRVPLDLAQDLDHPGD